MWSSRSNRTRAMINSCGPKVSPLSGASNSMPVTLGGVAVAVAVAVAVDDCAEARGEDSRCIASVSAATASPAAASAAHASSRPRVADAMRH